MGKWGTYRFIKETERKCRRSVDDELARAIGLALPMDEMLQLIYRHRKYTEDAMLDEKSFMESGCSIGLRELIGLLKGISFDVVTVKGVLQKGGTKI